MGEEGEKQPTTTTATTTTKKKESNHTVGVVRCSVGGPPLTDSRDQSDSIPKKKTNTQGPRRAAKKGRKGARPLCDVGGASSLAARRVGSHYPRDWTDRLCPFFVSTSCRLGRGKKNKNTRVNGGYKRTDMDELGSNPLLFGVSCCTAGGAVAGSVAPWIRGVVASSSCEVSGTSDPKKRSKQASYWSSGIHRLRRRSVSLSSMAAVASASHLHSGNANVPVDLVLGKKIGQLDLLFVRKEGSGNLACVSWAASGGGDCMFCQQRGFLRVLLHRDTTAFCLFLFASLAKGGATRIGHEKKKERRRWSGRLFCVWARLALVDGPDPPAFFPLTSRSPRARIDCVPCRGPNRAVAATGGSPRRCGFGTRYGIPFFFLLKLGLCIAERGKKTKSLAARPVHHNPAREISAFGALSSFFLEARLSHKRPSSLRCSPKKSASMADAGARQRDQLTFKKKRRCRPMGSGNGSMPAKKS